MKLQTPIGETLKVNKMYVRRLERLAIKNLEDLMLHIPFRYEDFSILSTIDKVQVGEIVTIQGRVDEIRNQYIQRFRTLQKAKISDTTGTIEVTWFNQPYLLNTIHEKDRISISGKVDRFGNKLIMQSPEFELMNTQLSQTIHTARLVPIYPETKGVSSKWLRRQVYKLLQEHKNELKEYLPYSIIKSNDLMGYLEAIEQIHFPNNLEQAKKARNRLAFDEMLLIHLSGLQKKKEWEKEQVSNPFNISKFKENIEMFWKKLPFILTRAQQKAVAEIFADLAGKKPMNRLLEGDVGSGKTVVSAIAMYLSYLNGFQSVLMTPTEILANQHYETISRLLSPFGVKVQLFTSSSKTKKIDDERLKIKEKSSILNRQSLINFDVAVGTHSLLYKKIKFDKLGLVVIDEQQRFGVEQRAIIKQKGKNPHLLTMTATPIPRTVALTLYGDLDLSILDEMPLGRKTIKTWLVPPVKREAAYQWIISQLSRPTSPADELAGGRATFSSLPRRQAGQLFVICPFIEESETMQTVKAATKEYERLTNEVFPNLKLGLIHGKLKATEKEEILKQFRDGKIDILVATPIVEVGIDIPNATIMLIEAAERFGLAQLHQLRGRVGRGDKQSYCLLFSESKNPQTLQRLKAMEKMHVGAELAELDLRLRGPGEIYGTMQHGIKMLKIASFSDLALIERTRKEAEKLLKDLEKYPILLEKLKNVSVKKVSPD